MNKRAARHSAWVLLGFALFIYALVVGSCSRFGAPDKQPKPPAQDVARSGPEAQSSPQPTSEATHDSGKAVSPHDTVSSEQKSPGETGLSPSSSSMGGSSVVPATPTVGENVIEVVLSFDDGPHVKPLGQGTNYTEKVYLTLANNLLQKNIKAVFFVQTHAPGRGASRIGQNLIALLSREGHVVGIHTGSTVDHASHCVRAASRRYDADGNGVLTGADGINGLESDLVRAKARILHLTNRQARYVRPTYGERNNTVEAAYARQRLKMILWDVVSGDNTGSSSVDEVNRNIGKGMRRCIAAGKIQIVVLFHDINSRTAANLEEYLANICISAREVNKNVVFATSTERVIQILDARKDR